LLYPLKFDLVGRGNRVHLVKVGDHYYYFRAGGGMKWMYKRDIVSFDYSICDGYFRVIDKMSIVCKNTKGEFVSRGSRIKGKISGSKRSGYNESKEKEKKTL